MTPPQTSLRDDRLMIVVGLALLLGLAIAIGLYLAWTSHVVSPDSQSAFRVIALSVCPSFILAIVLGPATDTLEKVLLVGSIVFGNAFLYAGVAAFVYFLAGVFFGRRRPKRTTT